MSEPSPASAEESPRAASRPRPGERPRESWLEKWKEVRTPRDAILRVGKDLRPIVNGVIARDSEVGDPPVFDPAQFPWTAEFEANWKTIRDEAEEVLARARRLPSVGELSPDHAKIAGGAGWKSYFLVGYGYRRDGPCQRCPETARLLEKVPGLMTAFFSIMEPGQYLKRHRGPTKAIITWHLPLRVPDARDDCKIVIDRVPYSWQEGRSLVFDDTAKHEVWNMTDQQRLVLLMHFRRPVRFPGSLISRSFLEAIRWSPFVQDAKRNQDEWDRRMEEADQGDGGRVAQD